MAARKQKRKTVPSKNLSINDCDTSCSESKLQSSVDRILDAAIRVFSTRPFNSASIQAIANEAEVKLPLLIYHFKSKENLYQTVLDQVMTLMAKNARPYFEILKSKNDVSVETAVKMLYELIDYTMDGHYDEEHPGGRYQRILYYQLLYNSRHDESFYQNHAQWIYILWTEIIKIITGNPDRKQAAIFAVLLFGMMNSFHFEKKMLEKSLGWKKYTPGHIVKLKSVVAQNFFCLLDRESPGRGIAAIFSDLISKSPVRTQNSNSDFSSEECHEPDSSIESVERIIEASLYLYQNQPFDTIPLKDIAKEAKVASPLIEYHFKSKANLHRVVFERALSLHKKRMEPFAKRWSAMREKIREEAESLFLSWVEDVFDTVYGREFLKEKQELALFHEVLLHSDIYELHYDRFYEMFFQSHYDKLAGLITIISGETDRERAVLRAVSLFGLILSIYIELEVMRRFIGMEHFGKEETEMIREHVIRYTKWIIEL